MHNTPAIINPLVPLKKGRSSWKTATQFGICPVTWKRAEKGLVREPRRVMAALWHALPRDEWEALQLSWAEYAHYMKLRDQDAQFQRTCSRATAPPPPHSSKAPITATVRESTSAAVSSLVDLIVDAVVERVAARLAVKNG